jgi:starch phosphorylase
MTFLALNLSGYINGVAKRHGEVSRHLFARYAIDAITNGVHAATWVSPPFVELFDQYIRGWKEDNFDLRYALSIPRERLWSAHQRAKKRLVEFANRQVNAGLDVDVFTLGFARRMTAYKRPDLIFSDIERLRRLPDTAGPLQIVFGGKAHPQDRDGKELIRRIHRFRDLLADRIRVAYLPNYDIDIARMVTSGVDLWLNTPQPPMEASGTSGMKAALNGVPSLSVLDGWWIEGCIEGVTGWSFGDRTESPQPVGDPTQDARSLYDKLEGVIGPMFYRDRSAYLEIMQFVIALNGSFFNTHRMIQQYALKAYL